MEKLWYYGKNYGTMEKKNYWTIPTTMEIWFTNIKTWKITKTKKLRSILGKKKLWKYTKTIVVIALELWFTIENYDTCTMDKNYGNMGKN